MNSYVDQYLKAQPKCSARMPLGTSVVSGRHIAEQNPDKMEYLALKSDASVDPANRVHQRHTPRAARRARFC